ncbi:26S proteasome regulatory subunit Rpn9p [[Candida] anglica]|uniref:26S proteasome regulatory subunit Rpn9p n=1 Tax=[Candida] anglica TaxID=148631 RepID=A0ABP0E9Q1_9ASCO
MSAMDLDTDVSTVLATLRSQTENADLVNLFYEFEDYYERKLWHQLTLSLGQFYNSPITKDANIRTKIYDLFVSGISSKLNQIQVVDFLLSSFEDCDLNNEESVQKATEKLKDLQTNIKTLFLTENAKNDDAEKAVENDEAVIYVSLQLARFYLLSKDNATQRQADDILEEINGKFEGSHENEFQPTINAAFYLTKCQLYKIREDYNQYYANGLLYLSAIASEKKGAALSIVEQQSLCHDLAIAALLGDKIYNFGELILHDILKSLEGSQWEWLYNLIQNLNTGNLKGFNQWLSEGLKRAPFLAQHEVFLKQKIIIMALLELISLKPAANKVLKFGEISEFTGADENDVEYLIIKCFSLGLIKGYINQIESSLIVTWLQPRILNLDQVKVLYDHLVKWDNGVEKLGQEIHENGGSIWAGV